MSMRFMDSFDHYGTNDILGSGIAQKWTGGVGTTFSSVTTIAPGQGRFGNCLRFVSTANINSGLYKSIDNQATWIIGLAFRISALSNNNPLPIVGLYDSLSPQVDVRLNTDGTLSVTRAGTALTNSLNSTTKSANTISINTWYYIEFMVTISSSISAHTCKVNVNGSNTGWLDISAAQNTKNTSNATANQISLGPSTQVTNSFVPSVVNIDYDDLYICDGQGSVNNAFLGDTRIEARFPLANGTNTSFLYNLNNAYSSVSEQTPDGDTSFIYSATTNDISTFTIPPTNATPSSIAAVQMIHCSRKTDAGNRQLADLLRSGSTNFPGTTQNLSNSYIYYNTIYENDPNTSAAWTGSAVNNVEIGIKEIT